MVLTRKRAASKSTINVASDSDNDFEESKPKSASKKSKVRKKVEETVSTDFVTKKSGPQTKLPNKNKSKSNASTSICDDKNEAVFENDLSKTKSIKITKPSVIETLNKSKTSVTETLTKPNAKSSKPSTSSKKNSPTSTNSSVTSTKLNAKSKKLSSSSSQKTKLTAKSPNASDTSINSTSKTIKQTAAKSPDLIESTSLNCPPSTSSSKPLKTTNTSSSSKTPLQNTADSSSDSDSDVDWDEVPEIPPEQSLEEYNPVIPQNGVEITLENETLKRHKRKRKAFDFALYARRQLNRFKKDVQISMHKVHLLAYISHLFHLNHVINSPTLNALALSFCAERFMEKSSKCSVIFVDKLLRFFTSEFTFTPQVFEDKIVNQDLEACLVSCFEERQAKSARDFVAMFVSVARMLNMDIRLCLAAYPISFKATDLIKTKSEKDAKTEPKTNESNSKTNKSNPKTNKSNPKTNKSNPKTSDPKPSASKAKPDENTTTKTTPRRKSLKKVNYNENESGSEAESANKKSGRKKSASKRNESSFSSEDDLSLIEVDSDNDFELKSKSKKKSLPRKKSKESDPSLRSVREKKVKILSSESSDEVEALKVDSVDYWVEVFIPSERKWICVDVVNKRVDKPGEIEANLLKASSYMMAIDNKFYIRDVTKKYATNWLTVAQKERVDPDWWEETIGIYEPPNDQRYIDEEKQMQAALMDKPMPKTVGEFKNHPLYALKRHLLKFEGIYPPDAPTLGFVRSEPIYARECVHTLHSRETWMKQAKVVKRGEVPYKIVKARPKWDKMSGEFKTDLPLEIFGPWQTEDYIPPPAKDGKVPRNEYGNIELFQPSMLPAGTVHLQLPGLNRIARKLGLDCAPALVGFDSHGGGAHPVFDGFVVCSEFKETLLAAWDEEQENIRKREQEKREKRVYDNWKKLIKGLLIRERIKLKYGNDN